MIAGPRNAFGSLAESVVELYKTEEIRRGGPWKGVASLDRHPWGHEEVVRTTGEVWAYFRKPGER